MDHHGASPLAHFDNAGDPAGRIGGPLLRLPGREVVVDRTMVMGVVNASPESFSDGRDRSSLEQQIRRCEELVVAGADVIDIGGQSAVTNQPEIDAALETERVLPLVEWMKSNHPDVIISVDTYKLRVVEAVIGAGADIINDVSGLLYPEVAGACAAANVALVIMHTMARPKVRLQQEGLYSNIVQEVRGFLSERGDAAVAAGLGEKSIIFDPGPDFTKTPAQTVALLRGIESIVELGRPVLLALSRKDFLGAITGRSPAGRDAATHAALSYFGASAGQIARVHDVAAARDVIRTVEVLTGRRGIDASYVLPDGLRYERK